MWTYWCQTSMYKCDLARFTATAAAWTKRHATGREGRREQAGSLTQVATPDAAKPAAAAPAQSSVPEANRVSNSVAPASSSEDDSDDSTSSDDSSDTDNE